MVHFDTTHPSGSMSPMLAPPRLAQVEYDGDADELWNLLDDDDSKLITLEEFPTKFGLTLS